MKVIDSCMFGGELDMLELRLREMDWCDWHIIVESVQDHQGNPKPLHYMENRERFAPWQDKLCYVQLSHPQGSDPWERLRWQHSQVELGLEALADGLAPEDWVLICDVDEILPELPPFYFAGHWPLIGFRPRIMQHAVDWEYPHRYEGAPEPRAARCGSIGTSSIAGIRDMWWAPELPVDDYGWHFTWLGTVAEQAAKLRSRAHTDTTPEMEQRVSSGRSYRDGVNIGGTQLLPVEVDSTWPEWIFRRECPASWFRPRTGEQQ